jgi:signal transduction histidine kinase
VDESLVAEKHELFSHLQTDTTIRHLPLQGLVEIRSAEHWQQSKADSMYTQVLYDTFSRENIPYRVLQSYVDMQGKPTLVRLKRSLIDGEDLIQSIIIVVVAILVIIITGMIVINRFSSKQLWSPFYTTLEKLRSFEIGKNSSITLPSTRTDEFNDLNHSINALTARSHEAYQSQKAFTENASHELQTPLAIFQGKLELLMQTQPMTAEQAVLISDLEDANRRMGYLNKNLLLLTRIENHQYYEKHPVSIDAAVRRIADQYSAHAIHKSINVQLNIAEGVPVNANSALIDILLSNLISNAIRHNAEGGSVEISVTKEGVVLIQNTGRNAPLDGSKLFMRFHKDSADKDSLGLGLAICHKICEMNGYQLDYAFTEGSHAFRLQLHG